MNPKTAAPTRSLGDATLDRLGVGVAVAGVVLGRDSTGRPVPVRLFGPEPFTVAFLGGWWAAQIVVFRSLACGARVAVDAPDGAGQVRVGAVAARARWLALDDAAGGLRRVRPLTGDLDGWPADPANPLIRLHDTGPDGPSGPLPTGAWQTRLTMLSRVTAASAQTVAGADVALIQRPHDEDMPVVGSALGLGPSATSRLAALDNDMLAVFRAGVVRYVWLAPTVAERRLFG